MNPTAQPTTRQLPAEFVDEFRKRGFCRIKGLLSTDECARYRAECLRLAGEQDRMLHKPETVRARTLTQRVNVWRDSQVMASLTLHPQLCAWATQLTGEAMRLWHDHVLIKAPKNALATEFHQDTPYWPFQNSPCPLSAWIALQDVPPERGCMSFIPGSHRHNDLSSTSLTDAGGLFALRPELAYDERVMVPLHAGDLTFHHGATAHYANANMTDDHRVAHTVIYMPRTTRYNGNAHVVTDPLQLAKGDLLAGPMFPDV